MAFTRSLYYPWIDVQDEGWLKSASLYWDTIQTIVPETILRPYSTNTARHLENEGILVPFRVRSDAEQIESLTQDVLMYLQSQEGLELLSGADRNRVNLHPDKLPRSIRRLARLHPMKMSHEIRYMLQNSGLSRQTDGGFMEVDDRFASFYMTLLATRLSETIGAGLVTSSSLPHRLSLRARSDSQIDSIVGFDYGYRDEMHDIRRRASRQMAQGMLVELMIEDIALNPETPVHNIINYRRGHASELGRFRTKVGELTSSLPEDVPLPAVRQYINDLYVNEVKPAMDDLKKSLTSSRIKWITNSWMKVAFISAGSSSVLAAMGLAIPSALLVGIGISLIGCGILYNVDKREFLRANPYSYLLPFQNLTL